MSEETAQMKQTLAQSEKQGNSTGEITNEGWPHYDGVPMVKISCAASELIPTRQYANVTVGPVQVTAFATPDGQLLFDPDGLGRAIKRMQEVCESAVAEERQTIAALLRTNTSE
jgi:hypothetical protein